MIFIQKTVFCVLTIAIALALASPVQESHELVKRGTILTAQYATESVDDGRFILENNLWGMSSASSGSQSSQVTAVDNNDITWQTTYTWAGAPSNVKSYANLNLRTGINQQLSAISSIPTTWSWTYTSASSDLVADVSYDLWLSNAAGTSGATSSSTYEIMVWLSQRGSCTPAGSQIGTASVNGLTWQLWRGTVESWTTFSFVAPSELADFNQDLKPFFTYLVSNEGIPSSQYLVQAQAGTEPFVGSATLATNSYSLAIN
ncbi:unnamed protein product [Cyclocybe aegerita]|uniref:Glycoside hydrolase family 12 protein n=1 Tax=Cyclocybe aegerita TaxID=1973307 RepID=A0A8S0VXJ4_CYCAE|nr:unnamed protein product [Cyclocybe aegerita]